MTYNYNEDFYYDYIITIEDAIEARRNLINNLEDKVETDDEYTELVLLIENETDELIYDLDQLNLYDNDEIIDMAFIADNVLHFCDTFYSNYIHLIKNI